MSDNIARIVPGRSDKEVAEDLKARLREALKPVLALAIEATESEFILGLQFNRDPYGRLLIDPILSKQF